MQTNDAYKWQLCFFIIFFKSLRVVVCVCYLGLEVEENKNLTKIWALNNFFFEKRVQVSEIEPT